jgi:hypothetical protein
MSVAFPDNGVPERRAVFILRDTKQPERDTKKQGATGITTVAPYVAGQWGRGE